MSWSAGLDWWRRYARTASSPKSTADSDSRMAIGDGRCHRSPGRRRHDRPTVGGRIEFDLGDRDTEGGDVVEFLLEGDALAREEFRDLGRRTGLPAEPERTANRCGRHSAEADIATVLDSIADRGRSGQRIERGLVVGTDVGDREFGDEWAVHPDVQPRAGPAIQREGLAGVAGRQRRIRREDGADVVAGCCVLRDGERDGDRHLGSGRDGNLLAADADPRADIDRGLVGAEQTELAVVVVEGVGRVELEREWHVAEVVEGHRVLDDGAGIGDVRQVRTVADAAGFVGARGSEGPAVHHLVALVGRDDRGDRIRRRVVGRLCRCGERRHERADREECAQQSEVAPGHGVVRFLSWSGTPSAVWGGRAAPHRQSRCSWCSVTE